MNFELLLLIHFSMTLIMTGVIWVMQLVHYPSFLYVDKKSFCDFSQFHQFRISLIVIPVMILELISSALLVLLSTQHKSLFAANLCILLLIWLITFFVSAPLHGQLTKYFDEQAIKNLVTSNWLRTLLWTTRAGLLGYIAIL